jgi:3-hydroxymyristoyl/3-hydroxydecanoyl-(acyl carrier protein) dehydratase
VDAPFTTVTLDAGTARATVSPAHALRLCAGHFPDDPLLPGAYLVELMADLAARLLRVDVPPSEIRRCVFHARVRPTGAIALTARRAGAATVDVEVSVDGTHAARARLSFQAMMP